MWLVYTRKDLNLQDLLLSPHKGEIIFGQSCYTPCLPISPLAYFLILLYKDKNLFLIGQIFFKLLFRDGILLIPLTIYV